MVETYPENVICFILCSVCSLRPDAVIPFVHLSSSVGQLQHTYKATNQTTSNTDVSRPHQTNSAADIAALSLLQNQPQLRAQIFRYGYCGDLVLTFAEQQLMESRHVQGMYVFIALRIY